MGKELLKELLKQFKDKEMTVGKLCEELGKIFPDVIIQFNGHVYKCENYFIQVEYLDEAKYFNDRRIKILNILDINDIK